MQDHYTNNSLFIDTHYDLLLLLEQHIIVTNW
jgi:hypothetical protein